MNHPIKYIIIDDEPIAGDIILNFCGHFPDLELSGVCGNALEARNMLQEQTVDLMFLDIQMPVLDGMSFLKTLKNPPLVIFTTAFTTHAVQAFDYAAVDYLVKPFSLERFVMAIDKVMEKLGNSHPATNGKTMAAAEDFVFLKSEGRIYKIRYEEILYAEANGNYTKIITEKETITAAITLSYLQSLLPETSFSRVHRSFIVNKSRIRHIEGNTITIGKLQIPVGSNYRAGFLKSIGLF